jgi:hypothetical protein
MIEYNPSNKSWHETDCFREGQLMCFSVTSKQLGNCSSILVFLQESGGYSKSTKVPAAIDGSEELLFLCQA